MRMLSAQGGVKYEERLMLDHIFRWKTVWEFSIICHQSHFSLDFRSNFVKIEIYLFNLIVLWQKLNRESANLSITGLMMQHFVAGVAQSCHKNVINHF